MATMAWKDNDLPRVTLGDPVPWFDARTVSGGSVSLHVDAGRWVVLAFLGALGDPRAAGELADILREAALFREDHLVFYGVLTEPPSPQALEQLTAISGGALAFI